MKTIWHIRGDKAGHFENLKEDAADALIKAGDAQLADGSEALSTPENHPDYVPPAPAAKASKAKAAKKPYQDKMMTSEDE